MASRLNYYQSVGVSPHNYSITPTPPFSCFLSLTYSLSFCLAQQQGRERSEKISEKQPSWNPWSVWEDRRYSRHCEVSLQPRRGPWCSRLFPCSPWGIIRADILAVAWGRAHAGAGGYGLKETAIHGKPLQKKTKGWSCSPWRDTHSGARGLVGPMLELSVPKGWIPWCTS